MPRPSKFEIYGHELLEHAPESNITAILQIRGYRCTKLREAIGKCYDGPQKPITLQELAAATNSSLISVTRVVKMLEKERLLHRIDTLKAYAPCIKPIRKEPARCHSFAICSRCKWMKEFIHEKHAHPKVSGFQMFEGKHEWSGLCLSCYTASIKKA